MGNRLPVLNTETGLASSNLLLVPMRDIQFRIYSSKEPVQVICFVPHVHLGRLAAAPIGEVRRLNMISPRMARQPFVVTAVPTMNYSAKFHADLNSFVIASRYWQRSTYIHSKRQVPKF